MAESTGPQERTEVRGVARNAKGGAVILEAAGSAVYVAGLDAWPAELEGKDVRATGIRRRRKLIPSPVVAADGAISAGAEGSQTVLDEPRCWLAPGWRASIGGTVTVTGVARNAKAGAIVDTPEGPAYLAGLEAWPPELLDKPVRATTTRLLRNKWPRSPANDDSEFGGEAGEQWLLQDSAWSAADAAP